MIKVREKTEMICPKCNTENDEKAKFCKKCGNNLVDFTLQMETGAVTEIQQAAGGCDICKFCGAPLRPGAKFCAKCGSPAEQVLPQNPRSELHRYPEPTPERRKSPLLLIICAVLGGIFVLQGAALAFWGVSNKASGNPDSEETEIETEEDSAEAETEQDETQENESGSEEPKDYTVLYSDYLNQHKDAEIALAYIDNDDIPEGIVQDKGFVQLITIRDGVVVEEKSSFEFEGGIGREDLLYFNEYTGNYAVVIHREDGGALEEIHMFKMGEDGEKGNAYYAGRTYGDPENDPYGVYTDFYIDGERANMYDYARYLEDYLEGMNWYAPDYFCKDVPEAGEDPAPSYYNTDIELPPARYFSVLDEDLAPMSEDELYAAMRGIIDYYGSPRELDSDMIEYIASWSREELDPATAFYMSDIEKENLRRIARYILVGDISYA